ncbi:MAG: hypothetical protein QW057_06565 [Candidatus Bathyarchaeia archaeon]
MERGLAKLLMLGCCFILLLATAHSTPRAAGESDEGLVKAYFSARPVNAEFSDPQVWLGYAPTVFKSADGLGTVAFYVKYDLNSRSIYAAFYVSSDTTPSPTGDEVRLYLDMRNNRGSAPDQNDYRFVVRREGPIESSGWSVSLGDWAPVDYPGWQGYRYDTLQGWGALMVIPVPDLSDGDLMGVGLYQHDVSSGTAKFPSGFFANNPSSWGSLLFTTTELVFDTSPAGVSPITVDGFTYAPGELPARYRAVREQNVTFSIPEASVVQPGARFNFTQWSDGSNETARSLFVRGEMNLTAEFTTEYYLSVSSPFGVVSGEGWYRGGANATFSVSAVQDYGNGTREFFAGWSGDYNGTEPEGVLVMDGPRNVTALWKTQHLLSLNAGGGIVLGEGWYDSGANVTVEAVSPSVVVPDRSRLLFTGWSGDLNASDPQLSLLMDGPRSLTANWRTQYYLAVDPNGGVASGEGWYDEGEEALLEANSTCWEVPGESRLAFTGWSGDLNASTPTVTIRMDAYKDVKANWKRQWYLTVDAAGGVVDKESQWVDDGASVTVTAASPCKTVEKQSRLVFQGWRGASNATSLSVTVQMDGFKALNASWRTEYYLKVESQYGSPQGEGWYPAGASATFTVTSPVGFLVQQVFKGWSGDSTAASASASLTMDGPKTVTALWGTDYTQLLVLVAVIVLAVVVLALIRVRRTVRWE